MHAQFQTDKVIMNWTGACRQFRFLEKIKFLVNNKSLTKINYRKNQYNQIITNSMLKDTLKAFSDFKNKQKSISSNVFWYVKTCIFWKCIQYTIHWDKTQMLKKIPSDKINGTKNALFFLSRAPTHHSFTFNLRFLYELKHKVRLYKTVRGIFIFDSVLFLLKFIFLFNKMHVPFDVETS